MQSISKKTLLGLACAALLGGPLVAQATPKHCPPGHAKKGQCTPYGHHAKGHKAHKVVVGQPLPAGAVYTIPQPVMTQLPPPPLGHRYAIVNNQVVLVSTQNDLVVDIIRGLLG